LRGQSCGNGVACRIQFTRRRTRILRGHPIEPPRPRGQ
jgi:hypothetical protein